MNRRYSAPEYAEKCELIRRFYPAPALTTDVIVGFPMETEEDFEDSYEFVKIFISTRHIFLNIPEDREPKPQLWMDSLQKQSRHSEVKNAETA